jgi:hypothetical protein
MSFEKNPEKIAFTPPPGVHPPPSSSGMDPNPRATPAAPAAPFTALDPSPCRDSAIVPRLSECCAICSKQGKRTPVERMKNGNPTGLCPHHNRFEKELRADLAKAAELGPLTPNKAKEIREQVTRSMHMGDLGGEESYVPVGHDRAWDPS